MFCKLFLKYLIYSNGSPGPQAIIVFFSPFRANFFQEYQVLLKCSYYSRLILLLELLLEKDVYSRQGKNIYLLWGGAVYTSVKMPLLISGLQLRVGSREFLYSISRVY